MRRIEEQIGSGLRHERAAYAVLLESGAAEESSYEWRYRYGRFCSCSVRIEGVVSETVTVVKPAISNHESGPIVRYTRKQIESAGASTLPQFFRYLALNAYSRPRGTLQGERNTRIFEGSAEIRISSRSTAVALCRAPTTSPHRPLI